MADETTSETSWHSCRPHFAWWPVFARGHGYVWLRTVQKIEEMRASELQPRTWY